MKKRNRELAVYHSMLRRCYNVSNKDYKHYGGRGIAVCARWRHSFESFLADLGPAHGKLLERIDNDGNYEPANCKWATYLEQANNKRNTRKLTFRGTTRPLSDWAREVGISRANLVNRLKIGWSLEAALTIPPKQVSKLRKLTAEQVRELRRRKHAGETCNALAAAFGVSRSNVSAIARGETWSNVA